MNRSVNNLVTPFMSGLLRLVAVVVLIAAGFVWNARPASACSCAPTEPEDRLENANIAFVGSVTSRREYGATEYVYRLDVETAVRGQVFEVMELVSSRWGSTCGFEGSIIEGQRIGLLPYVGTDGILHGGLCSIMPPETLLALGSPIQKIAGEGPSILTPQDLAHSESSFLDKPIVWIASGIAGMSLALGAAVVFSNRMRTRRS